MYNKKTLNLAIKNKFINKINPNVGCIVIFKNKIISETWHYKINFPHAEILSLSNISYKSKKSIFILTLEPCNYFSNTPSCCNILINSKIKNISIITKDLNLKILGKSLKKIKRNNIKIIKSIFNKESKFINKDFFKRNITGLPWIKLKIAISLNNKITNFYNRSNWITSFKSRKNVQKLRIISNSILSTDKTILFDNSLFNIRFNQLKYKIKNIKNELFQPIKIIIDKNNKIKPYHKLISNKNLIFLVRINKDNKKWPKNIKQIIILSYKKKINIYYLFFLIGKNKINNIFIESGSILSNFLLKNNIIDELIIYISPLLLNNLEKNLFESFIIKFKKKFIFYNIYLINFDIYLTLISLI